MRSTSPSALKYWVNYKFLKDGKYVDREWSSLATSAVQAINWYHEDMQRSAERNMSRELIRPKLRPDEYEVTLFRREGIAQYDLPASRNPDMRPVKKEKQAPNEFAFAADTDGQGKLAN